MVSRAHRTVGLALCLCAGLNLDPAWAERGETPILPPPPDVRYVADLVYAVVDGTQLELDLAVPKNASEPLPGIVCIHGGGWRGGHRRMCSPMMFFLVREGYVAATVSYRLAPQHRFPAQLDDVRRAVRWLRLHANEYHLDPARIGVFGISAGGHLALMLATADEPGDAREASAEAHPASGIQAVVSYAGPTDLSADCWRGLTSGMVVDLIGGPYVENPELYEETSPISHVDPGDPPVMIFHGPHDLLVPIGQSRRFVEELRRLGVSATLHEVENAGHLWTKGTLIETRKAAIRFFGEHLRPPEPAQAPTSQPAPGRRTSG